MNLFEKHYNISWSTVADIFQDCVQTFEKEICPLNNNDSIFVFKTGFPFTSTHRFGTTSFGYSDQSKKFESTVTLNLLLCKVILKDVLINTIYHELCHVAAEKTLVEHNCYIPARHAGGPETAPGHEAEVAEMAQNNGHGGWWLYYANKVNTILKPKLPIIPSVTEKIINRLFEAHEGTDIAYEITCTNPDCLAQRKFLALDFHDMDAVLLAFIGMQENKVNHHGFLTCKKCGSPLKVTFYDKTIEQRLELNKEDIIQYGIKVGTFPPINRGDN